MSTKKVLVTGVTGRTGSLVFKKLQANSDKFMSVGLARSPEKVNQMFGCESEIFIGDIREAETLKPAMQGCQALVILTSAIPKLKSTTESNSPPKFEYASGENPEKIDFYGQKNQIDVAQASGVEHIVLVGSMGGTMENHPLNKMGNGNILIWKRKAEEYLINSGIDYTIIRAGGLLDQPGGVRELVAGQNDTLLHNSPNNIPTSIPRADVAELVLQALQQPNARNKVFDVISKPENDPTAQVTQDFYAWFEQI